MVRQWQTLLIIRVLAALLHISLSWKTDFQVSFNPNDRERQTNLISIKFISDRQAFNKSARLVLILYSFYFGVLMGPLGNRN